MKVLLVTQGPDIREYIENLNSEMEIVHYSHPLKAMDNLEELAPQIIIWNYDDFPRHWKVVANHLAGAGEASTRRLYLVGSRPLSDEDTKKAKALSIPLLSDEGFFSDRFSELYIQLGTNQDDNIHTDGDHHRFQKGELIYLENKNPPTLFILPVSRRSQTSLSFSYSGYKPALFDLQDRFSPAHIAFGNRHLQLDVSIARIDYSHEQIDCVIHTVRDLSS